MREADRHARDIALDRRRQNLDDDGRAQRLLDQPDRRVSHADSHDITHALVLPIDLDRLGRRRRHFPDMALGPDDLHGRRLGRNPPDDEPGGGITVGRRHDRHASPGRFLER